MYETKERGFDQPAADTGGGDEMFPVGLADRIRVFGENVSGHGCTPSDTRSFPQSAGVRQARFPEKADTSGSIRGSKMTGQ